ncbi:hypothetical protein, partial [uncultured Gemmiger sp.]|uniref:hypothetical protein n=1 Tax=uncultured Gemmiger sp. TaxID=1623490 RepID=UPI0025FE3FE0
WLVSQLHSTRDLQTMSFLFLRNLFYLIAFSREDLRAQKNRRLRFSQPSILWHVLTKKDILGESQENDCTSFSSSEAVFTISL